MPKKIDFERVIVLLKAQQLAVANGALFAAIAGEATNELSTINADAQANVSERAAEALKNQSVAAPKELQAAEGGKK